METKFTPIAMRCNQEQFEAIKPKLERAKLHIHKNMDFICYPYLVNFYGEVKDSINCVQKEHSRVLKNNNTHETWNEATFLRACGIEVDEYLTVSKEFILEAHNAACPTWKRKLEEQFPSVFVKDDLEVGKWYKKPTFGKLLFLFSGEFSKTDCNIHPNYGFDYDGSFSNTIGVYKTEIEQYIPATPEEVETALINEAKKRGFKKGLRVNCLSGLSNFKISEKPCFVFNFEYNHLYYGGIKIFKNGKWAEIIEQPTEMTLEQRVANLEEQLKQLK